MEEEVQTEENISMVETLAGLTQMQGELVKAAHHAEALKAFRDTPSVNYIAADITRLIGLIGDEVTAVSKNK